MPELRFALRIVVPELVDPLTLSEVDDDAESHDRTQADAFERWLGGPLDEAVQTIAVKLPEGFEARIDGRFFASPSLEVSRQVYRQRHDRQAADQPGREP